jgi:hypothetical protein
MTRPSSVPIRPFNAEAARESSTIAGRGRGRPPKVAAALAPVTCEEEEEDDEAEDEEDDVSEQSLAYDDDGRPAQPWQSLSRNRRNYYAHLIETIHNSEMDKHSKLRILKQQRLEVIKRNAARQRRSNAAAPAAAPRYAPVATTAGTSSTSSSSHAAKSRRPGNVNSIRPHTWNTPEKIAQAHKFNLARTKDPVKRAALIEKIAVLEGRGAPAAKASGASSSSRKGR